MALVGYRGRIGRLDSEIADLHQKDARERKKAAESRDMARQLRAQNAPVVAERQSREARAAELEQVADRHERRAASFQRKLTEAGERMRRAKASTRNLTKRPPGDGPEASKVIYDICLTFADEQRPFVSKVYRGLKRQGYEVFYDEASPTEGWGEHMTEQFDRVFRQESRKCVMFISAEYLRKTWARWERRSALDRFREEDDYLLPARFDDTELPGLPPSVRYVDLRRYTAEQFVELVASVVGPPSRRPAGPGPSRR